MSEACYIGAYWGNRRETSAECAQRVAHLLIDLASCDDTFARWFRKGRSRKDALAREIKADQVQLQELLECGRRRRDTDRTIVEDLGFRIGLWNGAAGAETELTIRCGSYASTDEAWIQNSCVLALPREGDSFERTHRLAAVRAVLKAVVRAFDPDWAVVSSDRQRESTPPSQPPGSPHVGWITYFSKRYGRLPPLPQGVDLESIEGMGGAIASTDTPFESDDSASSSRLEGIRNALATAGLLGRRAVGRASTA